MLAAIVAWTGYQQHKLAKERLKLDLFEKRYAIYNSVQNYLSKIVHDNLNVDAKDSLRLIAETQAAAFLFGKEIPKFIQALVQKSVQLQNTTRQYEKFAAGDERDKLIDAEEKLFLEFNEELNSLRSVFAPYLRFGAWHSEKTGFYRLTWNRISKAKSV